MGIRIIQQSASKALCVGIKSIIPMQSSKMHIDEAPTAK